MTTFTLALLLPVLPPPSLVAERRSWSAERESCIRGADEGPWYCEEGESKDDEEVSGGRSSVLTRKPLFLGHDEVLLLAAALLRRRESEDVSVALRLPLAWLDEGCIEPSASRDKLASNEGEERGVSSS